jgi:hypothetical protein
MWSMAAEAHTGVSATDACSPAKKVPLRKRLARLGDRILAAAKGAFTDAVAAGTNPAPDQRSIGQEVMSTDKSVKCPSRR